MMTSTMYAKSEPEKKDSIARFKDAHRNGLLGASTYDEAFYEISQRGEKISHWMWYIFPQLRGLAPSERSTYYGIKNLQEACDYLRDPELLKNYGRLLYQVRVQLRHTSLENLFGPIDDGKLVSSITLFRQAATNIWSIEEADSPLSKHMVQLIKICDDIFAMIAQDNYKECQDTLKTISLGPNQQFIPKPGRFDYHMPATRTVPKLFQSELLVKQQSWKAASPSSTTGQRQESNSRNSEAMRKVRDHWANVDLARSQQQNMGYQSNIDPKTVSPSSPKIPPSTLPKIGKVPNTVESAHKEVNKTTRLEVYTTTKDETEPKKEVEMTCIRSIYRMFDCGTKKGKKGDITAPLLNQSPTNK